MMSADTVMTAFELKTAPARESLTLVLPILLLELLLTLLTTVITKTPGKNIHGNEIFIQDVSQKTFHNRGITETSVH